MRKALLMIPALIVSALLPATALWWMSQASALAPLWQSLEGVQSQFMAVMSVLFGLNLAFVCNEIWQSRDAAQMAIAREADALRNIGRIASNAPERAGLPVLQAARAYAKAAVHIDFPCSNGALATNSLSKSHTSSLPAVVDLSNALLTQDALAHYDSSVRSLLIGQLTVVRDRRLERLAFRQVRSNKMKWISLIFLQVTALLSIALVHISDPSALFASCLIFLFAVNPFLFALYHCRCPYRGLDPLKGAALREAEKRLASMEAVYREGGKEFRP